MSVDTYTDKTILRVMCDHGRVTLQNLKPNVTCPALDAPCPVFAEFVLTLGLGKLTIEINKPSPKDLERRIGIVLHDIESYRWERAKSQTVRPAITFRATYTDRIVRCLHEVLE